MTLNIYNTLTKKKEIFKPIKDGEVSFYTCGVTVYDLCHVGHARAYVAFDIIHRYLEYSGYKVNHIQNFTDIDDKILKRANERNISYKELTEENINKYFEDMDKLNIKRANKYPLATEYVLEMQNIIQALIDKKVAYVEDDVYFSVEKFKGYGKLSKKNMDDLVAGTRVDVAEKKHNPLDFVLWKKAKPCEPSWESPWGAGRPGWHIECSAMVIKELGETIDIHAGGEDLIFPHHENELAQSESYTGKPFVRYWAHNGFVNIQNEKMSKSKNNFFTIRDILKEVSGEALRFFLLRVHYRSPLNFSFDGIKEAQHAFERLQNTLVEYPPDENENLPNNLKNELEQFENKFINAMDNDFNYAEAVGILFDINKFINKNKVGSSLLTKLGNILGLFYSLPEKDEKLSNELMALIEDRTSAKKNRDFAKADSIRDILLKEHGIILEDTKDGVKWKHVH
jgi:cysteinyl-tRNA synthetase